MKGRLLAVCAYCGRQREKNQHRVEIVSRGPKNTRVQIVCQRGRGCARQRPEDARSNPYAYKLDGVWWSVSQLAALSVSAAADPAGQQAVVQAMRARLTKSKWTAADAVSVPILGTAQASGAIRSRVWTVLAAFGESAYADDGTITIPSDGRSGRRAKGIPGRQTASRIPRHPTVTPVLLSERLLAGWTLADAAWLPRGQPTGSRRRKPQGIRRGLEWSRATAPDGTTRTVAEWCELFGIARESWRRVARTHGIKDDEQLRARLAREIGKGYRKNVR